MKRYIRSSIDWEDLTGPEQTAVDLAVTYFRYKGMTLEEAAERASIDILHGYAEPEYEDEDFYGSEPSSSKVYRYLMQEYD